MYISTWNRARGWLFLTLRSPCFNKEEDWKVEVGFKPQPPSIRTLFIVQDSTVICNDNFVAPDKLLKLGNVYRYASECSSRELSGDRIRATPRCARLQNWKFICTRHRCMPQFYLVIFTFLACSNAIKVRVPLIWCFNISYLCEQNWFFSTYVYVWN